MGLEIINQRKKKKKLTNEELSVLSGVPKGTIDNYLRRYQGSKAGNPESPCPSIRLFLI